MKILLVCAGGFSTSILMKKMKKWAEENNKELEIKATGKDAYKNEWERFDCILIGPQISYSFDDIKKNVSIPVGKIEPMDYAMGNGEKIYSLAKTLISGGK